MNATDVPLADQLAAEAEALAMEREVLRRTVMYEAKNVQKDAPYKVGDTVFDYTLKSSDDPDGAEAKVIGLPTKRASGVMADGDTAGAKNYVWIQYVGGLRAWKKWTDVGPAQQAADEGTPTRRRASSSRSRPTRPRASGSSRCSRTSSASSRCRRSLTSSRPRSCWRTTTARLARELAEGQSVTVSESLDLLYTICNHHVTRS